MQSLCLTPYVMFNSISMGLYQVFMIVKRVPQVQGDKGTGAYKEFPAGDSRKSVSITEKLLPLVGEVVDDIVVAEFSLPGELVFEEGGWERSLHNWEGEQSRSRRCCY